METLNEHRACIIRRHSKTHLDEHAIHNDEDDNLHEDVNHVPVAGDETCANSTIPSLGRVEHVNAVVVEHWLQQQWHRQLRLMRERVGA